MSAKKVLFVTSNRIGDCVISSGVIREIARQIPGAAITVACGRPPAPFFRSAPGVERVIILDKKKATKTRAALQPREKTLTEAEIEALSGRIVAAAEKVVGAKLRG